MKWFLLVSFLFCFSALAEVVCRAPGGGDKNTEGGSASAECNPSATGGGAVDRNVNPGPTVANVAGTGTPTPRQGDTPKEESDNIR